jgi:PAS domain-containing protein
MLLVDPEDGGIGDANPAACSFYGYSREEITRMNITDINMLPRDEVFRAIERAKSEKSKVFVCRHRLANGEIRDVNVYSCPIKLLFISVGVKSLIPLSKNSLATMLGSPQIAGNSVSASEVSQPEVWETRVTSGGGT